jgi:hypothetical protein
MRVPPSWMLCASPRLSGLAWAEGKVELGGASDWAGGGLF